jgi:hypothetical protein
MCRHKVELVQFVGCHLNQLDNKFTAKNQMFGCLEFLVLCLIERNVGWKENNQFTFHFDSYLCDVMILWSVWNCVKTRTSSWQRSIGSFNTNQVCFERIHFNETHSSHNCISNNIEKFNFPQYFEWHFVLNTETISWHQQFLQIVFRNLLNWWKCVGRNNLNNVLYPFSFLFCFVVFSFLIHPHPHINSIIWFVSSLIEMLM